MSHVFERTQQLDFVSLALPDLFHHSPEQFLYLLERDGNKFLRFYWDETGKKLDKDHLENSFGLNHAFRQPAPRVKIALISLPAPRFWGEAFFAALVYRPNRRTPFGFVSDTTKLITLERCLEDGCQPQTLLVEWTRRLEREEIGPGPAPVLKDFYQAVLTLLD
jgi:hypothetical protein